MNEARPRRVTVLRGATYAGVWESGMASLAAAFRRLGVETRLSDDFSGDLPGFSVGIDAWGLPLLAPAHRHVAWFVDHPLRHLDPADPHCRHPGLVLGCACPSWVDWARGVGLRAETLTHAVDPEVFSGDPSAARSGIVFASGMADWRPMPDRWLEQYGKTGELFNAVAEAGYVRPGADLLAILDEALAAHALPVSPEGRTTLQHLLLREVELYLRLRRKAEIIAALAPLRPIVHGSPEWRAVVPPTVECRPTLPFPDFARVLAGAALTLNINPPQTPFGTQERAFCGAAAGAAVLSTPTPLLREALGEGAAWCDSPESFLAAAEELLANAERRRALAGAGQKRVCGGQTFDDRARRMLELASN